MKKTAHRNTRICAFCKYWHDPSDSAINPKYGNIWEYEDSVRRPCSKNGNLPKQAWSSCGDFSSKL